jgi:hypothetical protein
MLNRLSARARHFGLLCAVLSLIQGSAPALAAYAQGEGRPDPAGGSAWAVDAYATPSYPGLSKERLRTERNAKLLSNVEVPKGFDPRKPRPEDLRYRVIRCLVRHVQGLYSYHEKRAFFSVVGRIDLAVGGASERLRVASSSADGKISSSSKNSLTIELPGDAESRYAQDLAGDNFCSSPTMCRIYRLVDADRGDTKRSGVPEMVQEVLSRGDASAGQKSARLDPAALPYQKISSQGREEIVLSVPDHDASQTIAATDAVISAVSGGVADPVTARSSESGSPLPAPVTRPPESAIPVEKMPFVYSLKDIVAESVSPLKAPSALDPSGASTGYGVLAQGMATEGAGAGKGGGLQKLVRENLKDDGVLDLRLTLGFYDDPNPVTRAYAKKYPKYKGMHYVSNLVHLRALYDRFLKLGFESVPLDPERLKAVGIPAGGEKKFAPGELIILERPAPSGEGIIRISLYNSTNLSFSEELGKDRKTLQAQLDQSARAREFMKEAFRKSEGFIYLGHSRYGKGPDTYPIGYGPEGKLARRGGSRTFRGLNDLKEAAADRNGAPPLTTCISCASEQYFQEPLQRIVAKSTEESYFIGTTRYPEGDKLVDSTVALVENLLEGGTEADVETRMSAPDRKGTYRVQRFTTAASR